MNVELIRALLAYLDSLEALMEFDRSRKDCWPVLHASNDLRRALAINSGGSWPVPPVWKDADQLAAEAAAAPENPNVITLSPDQLQGMIADAVAKAVKPAAAPAA